MIFSLIFFFIKELKKQKLLQAKRDGTYETPVQRRKRLAAERARAQFEEQNLRNSSDVRRETTQNRSRNRNKKVKNV